MQAFGGADFGFVLKWIDETLSGLDFGRFESLTVSRGRQSVSVAYTRLSSLIYSRHN